MFSPAEKSWLITYDAQQFQWANSELLEGEVSEEKLNKGNGVIAVKRQLRKGVAYETTDLKTGDKVYITTSNGAKEMTVMGVLRIEYLLETANCVKPLIRWEALYGNNRQRNVETLTAT